VDVPVPGELGKLMLKLQSRNSHERFEAALELRRRGVDAGRPAIQDGLKAAEWYIRIDALRHAADFEDVAMAGEMANLLSDGNPAVADEADRCLASLLCVYPGPSSRDRRGEWKTWLDANPDCDRTELVREAMVQVIGGISDPMEERRLGALMVLRGLRVANKTDIIANRLADGSMVVLLAALVLLDEVCTDSHCNDKVTPLLTSADVNVRGHAAVYLAARGAGEEIAWKLQEAITVPGLSSRCHELLIRVFTDGPVLKVAPGDMKASELARLWHDWIITDETIKRKRDWTSGTPPGSVRPTLKPAK